MRGKQDAQQHVFRYRPNVPAERRILEGLVAPGGRVLDVGTAATGRSALLLHSMGCDVSSIDFNLDAIAEFSRSSDQAGIQLAAADLCTLPFASASFDLVLVAFHGMDYLLHPESRQQALREVERVLKPGGSFVFNGFNRLALVSSPLGLRSAKRRRLRAKYVLSGRFLRSTLIDVAGLELHQATPRETITEVERSTGLGFRYATDLNKPIKNLLLVALLSTEPYYVFAR